MQIAHIILQYNVLFDFIVYMRSNILRTHFLKIIIIVLDTLVVLTLHILS